MPLSIPALRQHFPFLSQQIDGHPLVYLDSAATSQKPQAVLDRMERFYREENANPHRGMHVPAERATVAYEEARKTVQMFLHSKHADEIVFTKNATEAINLVAISLSRQGFLKKGDRIVLSILEHHSNIVPWLQLQERKGIEILWVDCDDEGRLDPDQYETYLTDGGVKLVSVTAQGNVLGVRPDLKKMIALAHEHGALVLIDAAQSVAHHATDVQKLDCDFLVFSGHKLYGPTGIGVLYGKRQILASMPAFLGGGGMIQEVTRNGFTQADVPARFEAGTQPVAEAVGLAAAIDWLSQYSWKDIEIHERKLLSEAFDQLSAVPGLRILGPSSPDESSGCLSFVIEGVHPHDLTEILGRRSICLRAGHHCAQPLHAKLGVPASTRLSVGIYNLREEIERLPGAITDALSRLR